MRLQEIKWQRAGLCQKMIIMGRCGGRGDERWWWVWSEGGWEVKKDVYFGGGGWDEEGGL